MTAYYNEIDPYAAQWLRNLIAAGHIAPGDVDERSIQDVHPDDLRPYTQCHFFAGLGAWSVALRRAGWDDSRRVWTGSCPCQPFSQAGAGAGFNDERHLWPDFHWLIQQCRPERVFGEQVASKDADPWVDLVQADLEAMGYAFGAVPFPAAGVGSPNIRDRLYWVADADGERFQGRSGYASGKGQGSTVRGAYDRLGYTDSEHAGRDGGAGHSAQRGGSVRPGRDMPGPSSAVRRLADADGGDACAERKQHGGKFGLHPEDGSDVRPEYPGSRIALAGDLGPGPVNGLWRDADWLFCRDGKWRPVEPGTFPLVDGAPARVGRLRAYGNAINAEAAAWFIRCADVDWSVIGA